MERVSDVFHHWTKSAGSTPPRMFCFLSRAANVRARAYAHGHVCARACVGVYILHQLQQENPRKNVQAPVIHANILIDFDLHAGSS